MKERLILERSIIGALLFEDSYPRVAHVLRPANFSVTAEVNHQLVYQTMASMWPHKPIDILTVCQEIRQKHGLNYSYALAQYNASVSSARHLVYWGFVLLEIDIRGKFNNVILEWKKELSKDLTAAAILQEVSNYIGDRTKDIFQLVPGTIRFLNAHGLQDCAEDLKEMEEQLNERAMRIKKIDHYNRLRMQLERIESELAILSMEVA